MSDERIINRVKKMMALANDPAASDGERDNALRMAYATLAKYNLEMTDVEGKPEGPQEARTDQRVEAYGRPWAISLANAVGKLFFCNMYYVRSYQKDHVWFHFVGKESNAATACEVARALVESVFKEAKRKMRQNGENVTWRRSFCTGAAFKIQDRVRELQSQDISLEAPMTDEDGEEIPTLPSDRSTGTALVLVNMALAERDANSAWLADQGVKLTARADRSSPVIKRDAYSSGRDFGGSVNLSGTKKLS